MHRSSASQLLMLMGIAALSSNLIAAVPPSSPFDRDIMVDVLNIPSSMDDRSEASDPAPAPTEQRRVLYPLVTPDCPQLLTADMDGDMAVYQGDIVLGSLSDVHDVTDDPAAAARANKIVVAGYGTGLVDTAAYLWPKGVIPYTIDERLGPRQHLILRAIAEWNDKTNVTLVHADLERDFIIRNDASRYWRIHFVPSDKGYSASYVGRRQVQHVDAPRHAQPIWLQKGFAYRTVLHEIGHAIGLLHEHSRPDRDRFIQVVQANIQEQSRDQFTANDSEGRVIGDYDYLSIMHYSPSTFASGREPTFTVLGSLSPEDQRLVGYVDTVSPGDVAAVNAMYPEEAYHRGDFLLPECDDQKEEESGAASAAVPPLPVEASVMPSRPELERLAHSALPTGHPRKLSAIVAFEARPRTLSGMQLVEAIVTFADPSRPRDRITYVFTIHSGSSGPYVMYVKRG